MTPPSAPTIYANQSTSPGEIRFQWAPVDGATSYYVEQEKPRLLLSNPWPKLPSPNDFPGVTVTITKTSAGFTAVIDGLEPGKKFKHRVRARNAHGYSKHSNEKETKTLPLPEPTGLTNREYTDSVGRRVLVLDWGNVSGTGITYKVRIRDAEKIYSCNFSILAPSCSKSQARWETLSPASPTSGIYSVTFNGSEAEIKYPVDGREYEHQVRSVKGKWESDWSSKWTTQMPDAIPHLGHQKDHTVKYAPSTTHPPTTDISKAIGIAVTAWENAVGGSWPNLSICRHCGNKNTDGKTVTINVVSGETSPGEGSTKPVEKAGVPIIGDADCGDTTACVKPKGVSDTYPWVSFYANGGKEAPWVHMSNMVMVIEDPPWSYGGKPKKVHTEYVWTNILTQHGQSAGSGKTYRYLPAVVMHEFGHTLGLTDLYKYPSSDHPRKYTGYLMTSTGKRTAIPQLDIDYVKQVYRNAHGTEPH